MYTPTVDRFISSAVKRIELQQTNPWGFLAGTLAGGAYVGLGMVLILNVGQLVGGPAQKVAMGLTFAIALILVVLAGAELFTGYAMYMALALLAKRVAWGDAARALAGCWLGNFAGSVLVALLFYWGGGNGLTSDEHSILYKVAAAKTQASPGALFARAILCNWLVCLALWMSARVDSDTARCVVIFWCLLAFIISGYEHSVANMTLLSLACIGSGMETGLVLASLGNLFMVTLGNVVGGAVLVAGTYWLGSSMASTASKCSS